jgi:RHS repeat-associated protein
MCSTPTAASGNTCQSLTSSGTPNYTHLVSAFGFSRSSGQDLYDGIGAQFGYRDENTGFIYLLGHRFYDAQFGQFMTRDPMGYGGGVNLYGYVGNNPVNRVDPLGLSALDTIGSFGGGYYPIGGVAVGGWVTLDYINTYDPNAGLGQCQSFL